MSNTPRTPIHPHVLLSGVISMVLVCGFYMEHLSSFTKDTSAASTAIPAKTTPVHAPCRGATSNDAQASAGKVGSSAIAEPTISCSNVSPAQASTATASETSAKKQSNDDFFIMLQGVL